MRVLTGGAIAIGAVLMLQARSPRRAAPAPHVPHEGAVRGFRRGGGKHVGLQRVAHDDRVRDRARPRAGAGQRSNKLQMKKMKR